jgi:hypothetical protein
MNCLLRLCLLSMVSLGVAWPWKATVIAQDPYAAFIAPNWFLTPISSDGTMTFPKPQNRRLVRDSDDFPRVVDVVTCRDGDGCCDWGAQGAL